MATRNRQIALITNPVSRRNAKCKRTKGLIKKIKELSILCDLDINICIFDRQMNKI